MCSVYDFPGREFGFFLGSPLLSSTIISFFLCSMPNNPPVDLPDEATTEKSFSVSEFTAQMSSQLKIIGRVWIEGEVSNMTFHPSQHWYFDLKDDKALIKCAMYANVNKKMTWKPKIGDKIRLSGMADIYARNGHITFTAYRMERSGLGEYLVRLEELKQKLMKEGLFDPTRKRALPKYPKAIGIATSAVAAALEDILKVIKHRYPHVTIYLASCVVEGPNAPSSIVSAIEMLNRHGKSDVIIVGRGGGAKDSLIAFNDEGVVRAVANSKIPIVSAVGHEVDTALSDLAADVRAATPSHAAERVVPSLKDELAKIAAQDKLLQTRMNKILRDKFYQKEGCALADPISRIERLERVVQEKERLLQRSMERILHEKTERLRFVRPQDPLQKIEASLLRADQLATLLEQRMNQRLQQAEMMVRNQKLRAPIALIEQQESYVARLGIQLVRGWEQQLGKKEQSFVQQIQALEALSPLSILARGYSVALKNGKAVLDADSLSHGDKLELRFHKGSIHVRVEDEAPEWIQDSLFGQESS